MLFCFVAWMNDYDGNPELDVPLGGGSFINENGYGYEIFNFRNVMQRCYGYVSTMRGGIRIERLGASQAADSVSGVTVVFVARNPEDEAQVIVGWYDNATVFRNYQQPPTFARRSWKGERMEFNLFARYNNCTLLAPAKRTFQVPGRQEGGFGQSRLWYADTPEQRVFLRRVRRYLQRPSAFNPAKGHPAKRKADGRSDVELRQRIEKQAVTRVRRYFEARGFQVTSKELDCLGWDLEAVRGRTKLLLEVKGTSAAEFSCELTPNEYAAMTSAKHRNHYRLCVVTEALRNSRKDPVVFFWSDERNGWTSTEVNLRIEERVGARVSPARS
jgi:hypothetical protein